RLKREVKANVNESTILCDIRDGVARITLNRPDRLNSFTVAMHGELRGALERVQADRSVRVLLLTGAGRGFCAGQDLADRADAPLAQLAKAPTRGLAAIKRALYASQTNALPAQLDLERDLQRELGASDDYREGVAAFLDKRAPRFTGR